MPLLSRKIRALAGSNWSPTCAASSASVNDSLPLPVFVSRNASCRSVSGEVTASGLTLCSVTVTCTSSSTRNCEEAFAVKLVPGPTDQPTVALFCDRSAGGCTEPTHVVRHSMRSL